MIRLTKDLVMVADDHCYTVGMLNKQRADGMQGGCKANLIHNPTYYTTAEQAVQGALNRAMRSAVKDGSITTLREFIQEQDRQRTELAKLIDPLGSVGNRGENVVEVHEATRVGKDTPQMKEA